MDKSNEGITPEGAMPREEALKLASARSVMWLVLRRGMILMSVGMGVCAPKTG